VRGRNYVSRISQIVLGMRNEIHTLFVAIVNDIINMQVELSNSNVAVVQRVHIYVLARQSIVRARGGCVSALNTTTRIVLKLFSSYLYTS